MIQMNLSTDEKQDEAKKVTEMIRTHISLIIFT